MYFLLNEEKAVAGNEKQDEELAPPLLSLFACPVPRPAAKEIMFSALSGVQTNSLWPNITVYYCSNYLKSLEKENRALHRLRNEVQQLRQQTHELNQLRIKNQQLVQTLQRSNERGSLDAASLGFVSNEQWKDVGTNTPKQALTTFFYYLSQGDLRALVSRSTLDQAEQEPFENASPEDLEKAAESMKNFTKEIKSFRVQQLNQHDESHITVQVQTALNGENVPIKLLKQDNQWRFDMEDGAKFF